MNIIKKQNGGNLEIAVEGRLDTMTAPELEAELNQSMNDADSLVLTSASWIIFLLPAFVFSWLPIR